VHLAHIVDRAVPHAALDVSILVLHRAPSLFGTEHFAVLIGRALPFSAHHISVLILDAIRGIDVTAGGEVYKATDEHSNFHGASFRFRSRYSTAGEAIGEGGLAATAGNV